MILIRMPGGDLECVAPREFLWMRQAFDHEWLGTVMLRLSGHRIYSAESLADLRQTFSEAAVGLAEFTPPEGELVMVVNVKNVRKVEPSNLIPHHELARAILKFGPKLSLAVRETVEEARSKLTAAGGNESVDLSSASARRRKTHARSRKALAKGRRTPKRKRGR